MRASIILLYISLSILTFGQQIEKEQKVHKYLSMISQYRNDKRFEEIPSLDEKPFREIEKALYEAREIGEDALKDSLTEDHNRWMNNAAGDKDKLLKKVKYGIVEGVLLNEIVKRHTKFERILFEIPTFMKAKIISIKPGYDNFGFRVIMRVHPEEILKCKVPYLLQSEFDVYFRDWGEGVSLERDYKIGKSYMLPIWYRPDKDIPETKYSIATFVDNNGARFLVENDTMHDDFNGFGLGTSVDWKVFVDTVKNKIASILK